MSWESQRYDAAHRRGIMQGLMIGAAAGTAITLLWWYMSPWMS